PLRQLDEVRQVARQGGVELLHFSTHGNLSSQSIDRSAIVLEDDELLPQDLRGEVVWGLRRERPIVFLNACHSARLGFSLTGLGGWAVHMIRDVRVSAFIGALWEVHDELAALFAQEFYNRLQAGETLAEACYNARMHIRNLSPANSTWLAYTLYGDPNIRVAWGP
ncbi:MAG: CHAT domain-containing protein, partial [Caldilineae bacterium]